ncbi:Nitrogenase vanadium-cofactor synthesis protein VnfN [Methanosarcina siciliae C2J]|uniref:Nitrogenase vanadium-cofactor synthesis protein VnfN n=2 Tax=Methanosarcina siciliae TaxID=38027 RepID=A0A0E3LDW0_9EURY|nr:Nitrogenase vanadium-cofactor synthesis protein VnfN [Methanosarcina siciliae C2J]
MGASDKLKELIREVDSKFKTRAIFVIGTCAADIIGEDLEGLCRNLQSQINAKLIPLMAGGFRGDSYAGIDLGLNALFPFIKKQTEKIPNSVNMISPQANLNPTWWADLEWVREVLDKIGIKVLAVLPHETSLEELENAGLASANILLSHDAGYKFGLKMQEVHDIPLILSDIPLPVGLKNTAIWLRAVGKYFGVEEQVETIIRDGEYMTIDALRRRGLMMIQRYRNCRVAVSADATLGIGLTRMLFEELEMIPELLLFRSSMPDSQLLLENELKDMGISPRVVFSADGYQVKQSLMDSNVDAVFGSSWEYYMAEELGIKFAFDVFNPTNRVNYLNKAYFGYEGMLNFLENVANDWERALRSKQINWEEYL